MWRKRSSPRDSTPRPRKPAGDAAPAARRGRARRTLAFFRRRHRTVGLLFIALLFLALNALAFLHAYSMTHFVSGRSRMPRPDQMGRTAKVVAILTGVRIARPLNTLTPSSFGLAYTTHRYRGTDGTEYEAWHIPAGGPPWRRLPWLQPRGTVLLFH